MANTAIGKAKQTNTTKRISEQALLKFKCKAKEFTTCLDILIYNTKSDEAHGGNKKQFVVRIQHFNQQLECQNGYVQCM